MPEAMHIPPLKAIDYAQMAALTAINGFTIAGQREKALKIGQCIRERFDIARRQAERDLGNVSHMSRDEIEAALDRAVQPISMERLDLGDGRFVLIVGKGEDEYLDGANVNTEGAVRKKPQYSVLVPAHLDTVDGNELQLVQRGDRWEGLGVYDMGAAVLNSIDLAVDVRVPRGMKVYFVFVPDEEINSLGARLLISSWDRFHEIDCVASSEIGPLPPYRGDDKHMRLIAARMGREKMQCNVTISPKYQGHGAQRGTPNATQARTELMWTLFDRFNHGVHSVVDPSKHEPPVQRQHQFLGVEEFEFGTDSSVKRDGYYKPHTADADFSITTVPPRMSGEMVAAMQAIADGVAKSGKWKQYGINLQLGRNPHLASYEPYDMSPGHRLVQIASQVLRQVSGVDPELVGAPSVADECDYAAAMRRHLGIRSFDSAPTKGIIGFPINGGMEHLPGEWVSLLDIARVRFALKMFLQDIQGLPQLLRGN